MKSTLSTLIIATVICCTSNAHERITIGPGNGRLSYLDSATTPNAEFNVKEGKAHITLLDKDLKPITLTSQALSLTAGEKGSAKKLEVTKSENDFVATLPAGMDYWCIFQLKEKSDAKAITFRIHYNAVDCGECKMPEWRCTCGNKGSGKAVEIPTDLNGLWAEINGHHSELKEALESRDFAAIDEVTDALPLLLAALPGKSSDQTAEAKPLTDAAIKEIAAVKAAGATRTPDTAKSSALAIDKVITDLKKLYPAATANAALKK